MSYPQLGVLPKTIKRIRHFDGWVFRDEITRAPAAADSEDIVEIVDASGGFVAYAFFQPRSHIPLRILSVDREPPIDAAFWRGRLTAAIARRQHVKGTDARRLVHSEADGVPGLIVDQYGKHLVVQFRTAGLDRRRGVIVDLLRELLAPEGILERSDKEFRDEEGLPTITQVLAGQVPDRLQIYEDDLRFWLDPYKGHKTGFYLDQRPTRRRLRALAGPGQTMLETFSYTGSLAIAAAKQGVRAVCIEQDEPCLALAKENARLNGVEERIEWIAGDAFYWLDAHTHQAYDWVLLDPPSLAKSKTDIIKARSALHHLLVRGLRSTRPGGRMLLSICTYHLLGVVEEIVRIAAEEDGIRLQVLDWWTQPEDHPWILQMPPTRYLVSWLFSRDGRSAVSPTSTPR